MEKLKRIAALVLAILVPLFIGIGTVVSEIQLCKHNLWFVAVMYLIVFCFAIDPICKAVAELWGYFQARKENTP